MFFSTTTSVSTSTLLHVLVASASIPFVAAQFNTDEFNAKISSIAAPPGYNVEGGSVFTNFVNALNNKQFFLRSSGSNVFETPGSETVQYSLLYWCSDLTFSDFNNNNSLMGLAGRCVGMFLTGFSDLTASGAAFSEAFSEGDFTFTSGISAVFVEQQNNFECQYHKNTDDLVFRYWDDGRKTAPMIGWEGMDEGDTHPNAATSSFSYFGGVSWMPVEEVAQLFNTSTDDFTPETFKQVYKDTWIKEHEVEAATSNPKPGAELEIIEQVKNETDSTGAMTPAEPGTAEDGGTNAATPIDDGSAGNGRKLASVAARFVSAALRVFGI
jgi:hypothetical protein